MLIKNGQLKIKTINGKIVAKPDLKTAPGMGVVRVHATGKKGIRYRKIYKTRESRFNMCLLVDFASKPIEKKIDKTDVVLSGLQSGLGGGLGAGWIAGEVVSRKKPTKIGKYQLASGLAGAGVLGSIGAYQNYRNQRKNVKD